MPVTVSYDLRTDDNHRNYIRSMFERFGWKRLGGSVFRYANQNGEEDWLNSVSPALMFFRSYVKAKNIEVRSFTLDAHRIAHIDFSAEDAQLGSQRASPDELILENPENPQSSIRTIRRFVQAAIDVLE